MAFYVYHNSIIVVFKLRFNRKGHFFTLIYYSFFQQGWLFGQLWIQKPPYWFQQYGRQYFSSRSQFQEQILTVSGTHSQLNDFQTCGYANSKKTAVWRLAVMIDYPPFGVFSNTLFCHSWYTLASTSYWQQFYQRWFLPELVWVLHFHLGDILGTTFWAPWSVSSLAVHSFPCSAQSNLAFSSTGPCSSHFSPWLRRSSSCFQLGFNSFPKCGSSGFFALSRGRRVEWFLATRITF